MPAATLASRLGRALGAVIFVVACARNPATGERQLSLIGEDEEIALGKQADSEIVAALGLYPDEDLQRYVQGVGAELAARSERPNLPWTFRVLDDPVVNAFALPGGYVYVTRGIMTHLDSEAELAAVLGHEIGHVTGRHSVERMSQQQLAGIGLGVGSVISPELRELSSVAEAGFGLLFLKYGRDDERQADDLGVRYMVREGYDPRQMTSVFQTLERASGSEAGRVPEWLSTHPAPAERQERLEAEVQSIAAQMETPTVAREPYLERLDGTVFGDDPREGFFEGDTFHHPGLAFSLDLPSGWSTVNEKTAAGAISPGQDAAVVLSLASGGSPSQAAEAFFAESGVQQGSPWRAEIQGVPAVASTFTATDEAGNELAGVAAFVQHGERVIQLLGFGAGGAWDQQASAVESSIASFRRATDPRILQAKPHEIDVVEIPSEMTIAEFAQKYPSTVDLATIARINQADPDARVPAGTELKRVVAGARPA